MKAMKTIRTLGLIFSIGLICCAVNRTARADEWDKLSIITFGTTVQVPGAVLAPGTYQFMLADSPSDRNIVQIFQHDRQQLVTTVLAVPDYRVRPEEGETIRLAERPAGQPPAVATWFYPGDNFGQQFVYSRSQMQQTAQLNAQQTDQTPATTTPAQPDTTTPAATQTTAPQTDSTPAATPAAPAQTDQTPATTTTPDNSSMQAQPTTATPAPAPASTDTNSTTNSNTLPKTASPLPLVGLIGVLFVGGAIALKRLAATA